MVLPGYCLTIGGNGRDLGGDLCVLAGELADSSLAVNHLRTRCASEVHLRGVTRAGE